jgi:cell division protein FtsQ
MKKVLNRILWIAALVVVLVATVFANLEYNKRPTHDLKVEMAWSWNPTLASVDGVKKKVLQKSPHIVGQRIDNIKLEEIEKEVAENSQFTDVRAFLKLNGDVVMKVKSRKAILRVFDEKGYNLYLGKGKVLMGTSLSNSQRLLVASGHLPYLSPEEKIRVLNNERRLPRIYSDVYDLAELIQDDEFLDALIDQIYINKKGEAELIPKIGVKLIEFGNLENMEIKLKNLKTFYINGKDIIDWQKYRSINIKFENQVVCSKK